MTPNDHPSPPEGTPESHSDPWDTRPAAADPSAASLTGLEPPPERIGPYRILEIIGHGGMGTVYLAEQERPIRRRVALKLVKLGMDTREVVARFEAERQALAMMDHPNIAKVFDAGATEQGRPYFVMEHVRGVRFTDYCDRHRLTTRERLGLFVQVCHAIQHAHQKAIIHRDLKPSNVLVTIQDEAPVPKVIDFGVAKAAGHRLTERTLFTELGKLIGTPEYMSPEQAEMTGLNVDTRTDIYSLGVMLYEVLVGALPYEAREAGLGGVQWVIREKEPPPPSTQVSHLGEAATTAAECRRTTVPALRKQLRHELDWITMRALEKDRTRRYQTASEFAADLERYLRDEPVLASPPSKLYRLRKYAKRHKGPVAATLAVLVAIVTFGSLSLWQGQRARTEGLKARANAILAAAASAKDPLVKVLLVRELEGVPGLTTGALGKAQSVLGAPLPLAVLGGQEPLPDVVDAITVALSPNGARVVIGSWDGTARVWRADGTGEPVILRGHQRAGSTPRTGVSSLYYVGFSPDGEHVVTCGWDRTARVWPTEGGEPVVLRGHEDRVLWAAWSPDGARLVTVSADGTARIWPTSGGTPIVLRGHAGELRRVSFSPDGAEVVAVSLDGMVRVWRADGIGAPILLKGHEARVTSAIFSPDGGRILTASDDGTARVWRADGIGAPILLKGHEGRITSANFSPDGQRVVTASTDRTARVWRADGTGEPTVLDGHEDAIWWAGFSPDGARILTASEDGTARSWEPVVHASGIGNVLQRLPAESYKGRKIRFRAQIRVEANKGSGSAQMWLRVDRTTGIGFFGSMQDRPITSRHWREYEVVGDVAEDALSINVGVMLYGSGRAWIDAASLEIVDGQVPGRQGLIDGGFESGHLRGWWFDRFDGPVGYRATVVEENPAEGLRCVRLDDERPSYRSRVLASHARGIRVASFDVMVGKTLLTASGDGTARVWRIDRTGEPIVLRGHEGRVYVAAFSPDGQRIVTASADRTARVWRTDGMGEPIVLRGHESRVSVTAFSPDGQRIVTGSEDHTARVWRVGGTGEPVVLRGHEDWVYGVTFSPDGQRVVTLSGDRTARVWRADGTGEPVVLRGHESRVSGAAFSPDGQRIVTASEDHTARVWRADGTSEPVVLNGHEDDLISAAFSPDGQRVVTASDDGTARVWHADGTGEPVVLRGHGSRVSGAAFSPDGRRIVTASEDHTARVWRTDGTGEAIVFRGHEGRVAGAAFSPDGQRIVTASGDRTARVWRADGTGEPVVLRGHEGRVSHAAFSPDGERIVTASEDGTARVWRVTWEGIFDYLLTNASSCLEPEERMRYLGESRAVAWDRYADCERRHGRARGTPDAPQQ